MSWLKRRSNSPVRKGFVALSYFCAFLTCGLRNVFFICYMNESFINFIESKLVEVNDKIQILSDCVDKIKKKFPDVRKMSIEELWKINCGNIMVDDSFLIFKDRDCTTICFAIGNGSLYSVSVRNLRDKYGYTFKGGYTNGECLIGEDGKYLNGHVCLLNIGYDKELADFILNNNLEITQEECFCVRNKDYYVLEDYHYNKGPIFKANKMLYGAKYSRYISKVKISKNGDIELID